MIPMCLSDRGIRLKSLKRAFIEDTVEFNELFKRFVYGEIQIMYKNGLISKQWIRSFYN
jgi:hypothetical protein